MTDSHVTGSLLLIVGVLLIVIGAGLADGGYNQMQAADHWGGQTHFCGTGDPTEVDCPDNPYGGGDGKILIGLALVVVGGVATRYGAR